VVLVFVLFCFVFCRKKSKMNAIAGHSLINMGGPSWLWSYGSWIYNYLCNQWISLLMLWVRISIRARCTTLCDKVCQWLATDRWFSPGRPVSSTNKTDRHDITEILLKMTLKTIKQTNIINIGKLITDTCSSCCIFLFY
jgi:hypothetical protein